MENNIKTSPTTGESVISPSGSSKTPKMVGVNGVCACDYLEILRQETIRWERRVKLFKNIPDIAYEPSLLCYEMNPGIEHPDRFWESVAAEFVLDYEKCFEDRLDYSLESLAKIEAMVRYVNLKMIGRVQTAYRRYLYEQFVGRIASYFGEVIKKCYGGNYEYYRTVVKPVWQSWVINVPNKTRIAPFEQIEGVFLGGSKTLQEIQQQIATCNDEICNRLDLTWPEGDAGWCHAFPKYTI